MNCPDVAADLVDLARNALSGPAADRVNVHVEGCPACAARLAQERRLSEELEAVARTEPAAAFDRVEAALLAAFEARHSAPVPRGFLSWHGARWLAAAAVVVASIVTWRLWPGRPGPADAAPGRNAVPVASAEATLDEPSLTTSQAHAGVPVETAPRPRPAATGRPAATPGGGRPGVVQFVSLPTAVGLPELESGRVVRVELPMAALPAYGIEISADDAARVIEADILVGQDGQPRGIRFVNPETETRRRQ